MVGAAIREVISRYPGALAAHPWLIAAGVLVAGLLAIPQLRALFGRKLTAARALFFAITTAGACAWAWSLLWASDDAYISFRYALNLVRGRGLVFNAGERVEGYTNFLWTMLMAGAIRLGIDPGHASIALCLASFIAVLVLLERLARRLVPVAGLPIGVGPLLAAFSYPLASYATSGLETMFATALVLFALDCVESRRPVLAGVAATAAALAHPDHLIFGAALGAVLLLDPARRKELVAFAVPCAGLFAPYVLWRWHYYGDLWPNTYYAKSADRAYFEQGLIYLATSTMAAGLPGCLPIIGAGVHGTWRSLTTRFALLALPLYLVYVAKIGGDFMLGRLLLPALALCFLLADLGFRTLLVRKSWRVAWALGAVAALAVIPTGLVKPGEIFHGIADERTFTPVTRFSTMEVDARGYLLGKSLHRSFVEKGVSPKVALFSLGMASYYADLPVFDLRGLTSRSVAHLPIRERGRPGHEKLASTGLLLDAQVDLSEMPIFPPPYESLSQVTLDGFPLHLARHQPELVSRLPGLPDFRRHLDSTIPALQRAQPERAACDLWQMREYYFSVNRDDERRAAIERAAVEVDPALEPVRSLLLETRELDALGWRRARSFTFEPGEPAWSATGDAPSFPRAGVPGEQLAPFGFRGPFVNTFTTQDGDRARGSLVSPDFIVEGDVATFLIGGGFDPLRERLALLVDGQVVRRASGCDSEWLGSRVWDLRPFKGRTARWQIADDSDGPWGHLLVDELVEWSAPPP